MAGVSGVDKSQKVGDKVNCCRCLPAALMYPCRALCGALKTKLVALSAHDMDKRYGSTWLGV